jgi:hypothetical protein
MKTTEYILRSQTGRDVMACGDEARARARMAEMAERGTRLRLFKLTVTHSERELAA